MGGRGGSSGLNFFRYNSEIEKIRKDKTENLRVFDSNGNLVYSEGGTKGHTGYEEVDYSGKIAVHNHPKGYYPFASNTDFETFEKSGAKEMVIVSRGYTMRLRKDPSYKNFGREGITSALRWSGGSDLLNKARQDLVQRKISQDQYITKVFEIHKKAAKRSGYILSYEKYNPKRK